MGINPGFVVIPILIAIGLFLSVFLRCTKRGRKLREQHAIWRGKLSLYHWIALRQRERRLSVEVEKRKTEERETDNGVPVWFSRYIYHGQLKHWVLIINEVKYELRKRPDTNEYIYSVKRYPGWKAVEEKRQAALTKRQIPDIDGFYICLIGWTRLSDDELEKRCQAVKEEEFKKYNILWQNCQHFLQKFADQIVSTQAIDWAWFRENTKTEYQSCQQLPRAPPAILQAQFNLQKQHGHREFSQQTQIQLNNQFQVMNMNQTANLLYMQPAGFVGGQPLGVGGVPC